MTLGWDELPMLVNKIVVQGERYGDVGTKSQLEDYVHKRNGMASVIFGT